MLIFDVLLGRTNYNKRGFHEAFTDFLRPVHHLLSSGSAGTTGEQRPGPPDPGSNLCTVHRFRVCPWRHLRPHHWLRQRTRSSDALRLHRPRADVQDEDEPEAAHGRLDDQGWRHVHARQRLGEPASWRLQHLCRRRRLHTHGRHRRPHAAQLLHVRCGRLVFIHQQGRVRHRPGELLQRKHLRRSCYRPFAHLRQGKDLGRIRLHARGEGRQGRHATPGSEPLTRSVMNRPAPRPSLECGYFFIIFYVRKYFDNHNYYKQIDLE